ncbi:MAG: hypothetical protein ABIJ57_09460 [Pseudomonadota bacterium]
MATTYNIPTSSLGKIQRWYNAQKAAGRRVSPYELEAAYRGELGSLAGQQTTNRQITLNEAQAGEARRMNEINTGLTREQMAEAARMNEINTALSRERMAADATAQERALAQQSQLAEKQMAFNQAQAAAAEARAIRMEARQKEIDDYEKLTTQQRTDEDTRRYEQNRIDQAADRDAAKSMQMAASLTSVGGMAGLSLLFGKDASGASLGGDIGRGIGGGVKKGWNALFGSDPSPITDADYQSMGGPGGGLTQDISYDAWAKDPANAYLFGDTYAGDGYGLGSSDLDVSMWDWDPGTAASMWDYDYGTATSMWDYDYGMGAGDFSGLDYSSLVGSGLDWGSDWASGVDWGSIDWSGLF